MSSRGQWIDALGQVFTEAWQDIDGRWFAKNADGIDVEVTPVNGPLGADGIGADSVLSGTGGTTEAEMVARLREIYGREPTAQEIARAMGTDVADTNFVLLDENGNPITGPSDVATTSNGSTDVATTGGTRGGGSTDVTTTGGTRGGGSTDVATTGGTRGGGSDIIDAEWREIDGSTLPEATKAKLSKRNIVIGAITGIAIIGGATYLKLRDGTVVPLDPNNVPPGGTTTQPTGPQPNDDPGGGGSQQIGSGGGGGSTGGGGGGSAGGGGYSSGGGGSSGFPSGFGSDNNYYPVLPMTEQRRKMLLHASAVYGKPMGGFRTPPGGWDPRMEAMFTTGAFEPQMASQEEIDAYRNKPKPQLPKLPNSSASLDNLPSGPTVPGGSWQQQSSSPRGGSGLPSGGYGNIPVPRPNAKPNTGASPASFTKPAGAAPAGSANQPPSWADLMGRTSPATKMTGQTPATPPAPANTMQAQNWWNQVANPSTGSYDFTNAPFPPGYSESSDAYAQRLAATGFPVYNGSTTPPAKSTSTAPLSYQDMLNKLRGQ